MSDELFNSEQRDHMAYLARIPLEKKCWCGWYLLGDCPNCGTEKSCADKVAMKCPACGNSPSYPGTEPLHHIKNCTVGRLEAEVTRLTKERDDRGGPPWYELVQEGSNDPHAIVERVPGCSLWQWSAGSHGDQGLMKLSAAKAAAERALNIEEE